MTAMGKPLTAAESNADPRARGDTRAGPQPAGTRLRGNAGTPPRGHAPAYLAPARWQYHAAHIDAGAGTTACGLDTTSPEDLWQPVPAEHAAPVCIGCAQPGTEPEELTLL